MAEPLTYTDFFLYFHICFTVLFLAVGTLFVIFAPLTAANWITAGATLLICSSIYGILKLLQFSVDFLHKKLKIDKRTSWRNTLLIGTGGMTLSGIIPRVLVFFVEFNPYIAASGLIVCLVTIVFFYGFFFLGFTKYCTLDYTKDGNSTLYIKIAHLIILIAMIKIGISYTEEKTQVWICCTQLVFAVICVSSMLEFWRILRGGLHLKSSTTVQQTTPNRAQNAERARQITLESQQPVQLASTTGAPRRKMKTLREMYRDLTPTESRSTQTEITRNDRESDTIAPSLGTSAERSSVTIEEKSDPRLECKICMLEYTEALIPRMLKECGHTVCEECAENLLKKSNGQHLFCPFCQKVTVVNGPSTQLPKNFTITDMIDERSKKKKQDL